MNIEDILRNSKQKTANLFYTTIEKVISDI